MTVASILLDKYQLSQNQLDIRIPRAIQFSEWVVSVLSENPEPTYLKAKGHRSGRDFLSQWLWITDGTDQIDLDFIGKFESLDRDLTTVCERLSIPKRPLKKIKSTRHEPYWTLYDKESIQAVADYYSDDIEKFGYDFR